MENIYLKQEEFERVFKKHIKSSVYSLSIKTLFGKRMERKINYHPYYQRNYVWDNSKASFFIESILLGTDIPPLIFFNTGSRIEVIDGRQRYETLKRFKNGDTKLNLKGLTKLPQLSNKAFSKLDPDIQNIFFDSKIRIFEFEVLDEPRIDVLLEDKIKKEIFRRYNSGITPLNSAEIDNATYDDDEITNTLKEMISDNSYVSETIKSNFLSSSKTQDDSRVLQFMRRYLVLSSFPIKTYATGNNRTEILDLLYSVKSNDAEDPRGICDNLIFNIKITEKLISKVELKGNRQLNECLLWAIFILLENGVNPSDIDRPEVVREINRSVSENRQCFTTDTYYHYRSIIERHSVVAKIFNRIFKVSFALYISDDDFKENVRDMRQSEKEAKLKIDELSSLRVQKPEPSIVPVEEIVNELGSNNYLVRPSYQRQEKINVVKASAIIESIVLGINLPPLFILKTKEKLKK